jgi:hypothetical protein
MSNDCVAHCGADRATEQLLPSGAKPCRRAGETDTGPTHKSTYRYLAAVSLTGGVSNRAVIFFFIWGSL